MIIRVYLKDDLSVERVDGTTLLFVGVDKVKFEVYSKQEIDCDLIFERPDGYVYGPVTRDEESSSVGGLRVNKFTLDATLFRKVGPIQCSIRMYIDGQTKIAYCIFENLKAVNKHQITGSATVDDIRIKVESLNIQVENLKNEVVVLESQVKTLDNATLKLIDKASYEDLLEILI